jgi:transcriptional regulator with PAS, ATPase and Fis domain
VLVPPLRERIDDLPILLEHFLSLENPPRNVNDIAAHVWDMFRSYRWPGNVRELRNAAQRLLVTPERALAHTAATSAPPQESARAEDVVPLRIARREAGDAFECRYLETLLARTGGNVTRAAAIAEVSRQMVQKLMRKHGIGERRGGS